MLRCKGRRSKVPGGRRRLLPASAALLLAGCGGPQSALVTAGRAAEAVAGLFWIMLGGAAFTWVLVICTPVYAPSILPDLHLHRVARRFLTGGAGALPRTVRPATCVEGRLLMVRHRRRGGGTPGGSGTCWAGTCSSGCG